MNYYTKFSEYHERANSLEEAKKLLEKHEKELHDGKQYGTFGVKYE